LVAQLKTAIEESGLNCELFTDLTEMASRARMLNEAGMLRTVVAAGGDGTASVVASLIPNNVPITVFPTGSENLLAKHFAIVADPAKCAQSIQRMRTKQLDVMTVNDKLALLMASIGFDAEVVRCVHIGRKSHISKLTYWRAILKTLWAYQWPKLRVQVRDDKGQMVEELDASWVFVFNVPRYASGISIINDSIDDDGNLDIGVFEPGGLVQGLWYYLCVLFGKHHSMKQWRRFRSPWIQIEIVGKSGSIPLSSCQTDGDWACELPVVIKIIERKLTLVVS
jgi:diacylglycerol kinase family enzyme